MSKTKNKRHKNKSAKAEPIKVGSRGKAKQPGEASGQDPAPSFEGRSTMQSEHSDASPHPDGYQDPRDGAAVIPPVTDAMMDHAAHEAAALADGVAQGTIALERTVAETGAAARDAAEDAVDLSERASAAAGEAAQTLVDAATEVSQSATHAAESAAEEANRAVERGAEAARDALPALAEYNAKVIEIMRSNLVSTQALFTALIQAKSVPEALSLNADHVRRQMEALTTQGRELATLAQRIAFDAMRPFKGTADR